MNPLPMRAAWYSRSFSDHVLLMNARTAWIPSSDSTPAKARMSLSWPGTTAASPLLVIARSSSCA
jgi:hypothetical protein